MTIGESIRYHRKRLLLTQNQLAERIGVSAQAVSKWENGKGLPDILTAVSLARALGTTTDELLRFGERYSEFEELWALTLKKYGDNAQSLLPIANAALKEFPNDALFLYRAAMCEYQLAVDFHKHGNCCEYIERALANAKHCKEMAPDQKYAKDFLEFLESQVILENGVYVLR